jgi:malate dehydrogenase (oxaloacetate-decarboxylating)
MKYGFINVIVCDAHGTIYNKRKEHMNVYKEIIANTTNNNDTQATTTKSAITSADIFINMCEYNKSEIYNALKTMNSRPIIITTYEHADNAITETIDVEFGVYIAGCCTKGKANYIDSLLSSTALISAVLLTNANKFPIEAKIAIAKAIALSIPDSKLSIYNITPKLNELDTIINIICKACEEMGKNKKIDIDYINDSLHCFYNEGYLLPIIPRK